MAFRTFSYLAITALLCTRASAIVFTFDCNSAKGVCDTHCFASHCGAVDWAGQGFHRDLLASTRMPKAGSTTTTASFRRAAIGCVNDNPCSGGASCDEIPYASTYDGGLGCFPQGFTGNSANLFHQGAIHCVSASDNSAHGALLNNFYTNQNIADSALFTVALLNSAVAPLCNTLNTGGACPDEGVKVPLNNYYLARTAPDNTYCPDRQLDIHAAQGSPQQNILARRRRTAVSVRFAITDNGMRIRETIGQLAKGDKVWSMSENGTEVLSTIIDFE